MKLNPQTLTGHALCCFDTFFHHMKSHGSKPTVLTEELVLMGINYLSHVIFTWQEGIAQKAIVSMVDLCTDLPLRLKGHNVRRGRSGRERKVLYI